MCCKDHTRSYKALHVCNMLCYLRFDLPARVYICPIVNFCSVWMQLLHQLSIFELQNLLHATLTQVSNPHTGIKPSHRHRTLTQVSNPHCMCRYRSLLTSAVELSRWQQLHSISQASSSQLQSARQPVQPTPATQPPLANQLLHSSASYCMILAALPPVLNQC